MPLIISKNIPSCRFFIFRGKEILLRPDGTPAGEDAQELIDGEKISLCFADSSLSCGAVSLVQSAEAPENYAFAPLRTLFASGDASEITLMARMKAFSAWLSSTRYCPSCGTALEPHALESALVCPTCGKMHYPKIEPCVIAVICKGDEILLLRHVQRNQDMYCCLAGFVEAGESLEQSLRREVREEVGIEIDNIRYVGSQSWPFPSQLMLGFYADYKSGDLKLQESEIFEAKWFDRNNLPNHPPKGSISWNLIHFVEPDCN